MPVVFADENNWNIQEYVDEFDLPTGELYLVSNQAIGTFSNSVVTKEKLVAYLFYSVDGNNNHIFSIRLIEYGDYVVSNNSSKPEYYDIAVKDAKGDKYKFSGYMPSNSRDIFFDNSNYYLLPGTTNGYTTDNNQVANILYGDGLIYFSIVNKNNNLTKYVFSYDPSGFKDARSNLIGAPYSLSIGMTVIHKTKGEGIISLIYSMENQVKVQVLFSNSKKETFVIPEDINNGTIQIKE